MSSRSQEEGADALIRRVAAAEHGVVARWQLLGAGVPDHIISRRVRQRRLIVVRPGVYAAGPAPLSADGHRMAAVLAAGPDGVLSGRAAGAAWALRPYAGAALEVTCPRSLRPLPGLPRRHVELPADERDVLRGIPITSISRTLLDLARVLSLEQLRRAVAEAERQRLGDPVGLAELARRHPRAPGVGKVRVVLADRSCELTRSELEILFLELVDRAGLPRPRVNALVAGHEVDMSWPAARLVVELDSRGFHGHHEAFETDRRRDRALAVAGWTVVRVTWRALRDEPERILAELRTLLARAA